MKSNKLKVTSVPRSIEDITKEYVDIKNRLADSQYQVYVFKREADAASKRMLELNQEGAERNRLNAEIEKEVAAQEAPDVKS